MFYDDSPRSKFALIWMLGMGLCGLLYVLSLSFDFSNYITNKLHFDLLAWLMLAWGVGGFIYLIVPGEGFAQIRRAVAVCLIWLGMFGVSVSSDIDDIELALQGKKYLLPPTDAEMQTWEIKTREHDLHYDQIELNYVKHGKEVPIDVISKSIKTSPPLPDGHNPPATELRQKLNNLKTKRIIGYVMLTIGILGFMPEILQQIKKTEGG